MGVPSRRCWSVGPGSAVLQGPFGRSIRARTYGKVTMPPSGGCPASVKGGALDVHGEFAGALFSDQAGLGGRRRGKDEQGPGAVLSGSRRFAVLQGPFGRLVRARTYGKAGARRPAPEGRMAVPSRRCWSVGPGFAVLQGPFERSIRARMYGKAEGWVVRG
jgi:hypothetical protein